MKPRATQIHEFAEQGDIAGVRRMLAKNVDIDLCHKITQKTPLMYAAESPHAGVDMLQFLVERGANVNALSFKEELFLNPLSLVIQSGNVRKVQFLIDAGAEVTYESPNGYDALIDAMHGRDIKKDESLIPLLTLLINKGANLQGITTFGEVAILVAAKMGRFDAVKLLWDHGADIDLLELTPLMKAVLFGSIEDVRQSYTGKKNLIVSDIYDRTAFLLSVLTGEIPKTRFLLEAGAAKTDVDCSGNNAIMCAVSLAHREMLAFLIDRGISIETPNNFGDTPLIEATRSGYTEIVKILLERGANPLISNEFGDTPIKVATNINIIQLLVKEGADIGNINDDMRFHLRQIRKENLSIQIQELKQEDYFIGKFRKFGKMNPEVMDFEFWRAMIRNGAPAYQARRLFSDTFPDTFSSQYAQPIWCYDRFGRSITLLPDGRIVEIGGEHEDYYDSDFCIYNDVVVFNGKGDFTILGYPEAVFPPTDFHTATLVDNYIYIIGSLGYMNKRLYGETPVYRLSIRNFEIEKIHTKGENPGWISDHHAMLTSNHTIKISGGKTGIMTHDRPELIKNEEVFELDLTSFHWTKVPTLSYGLSI